MSAGYLAVVREARAMIAAGTMTAAHWDGLSSAQRAEARDESALIASPLHGYAGCRVEVVEFEGEKPRRFNVGCSTGWRPCYLEIHNARSHGGPLASKSYASVRFIRRVR